MNKDTVSGNVTQMKGKIKQAWGRLTDDEVALYEGNLDEFYGKLQEKYGIAKDDAKEKLDELKRSSAA